MCHNNGLLDVMKLNFFSQFLITFLSRVNLLQTSFMTLNFRMLFQLLSACHARTLTLFVESFLKTIQKMLESSDPLLQILASTSFRKFSNIEEETPSYHRTYDFFIDRFAQVTTDLCLCSFLTPLLKLYRSTIDGSFSRLEWCFLLSDTLMRNSISNPKCY